MKRWVLPALAAFLGGAAASVFKLWIHCRRPDSEACVWGQAYLPLTLPIETLAFGFLFLGTGVLVRVLKRGAPSSR